MSSKYFHNLRICDIQKQGIDCVVISFDIPTELKSTFTFQAGQYLTIKKEVNGENIRRSYSICTAPEESKLSIAVKKIAGGKFSSYANDVLKIGETLEVMAPTGNFVYHAKANENIVFFAAGSGITPILSHIKHLLSEFTDIQITLFYGNKNADSIIFKEELEGLKNKYLTRFSLYHILSKEKVGIPLFYGRIDGEKCQKLSKSFIDIPGTNGFFLCGPSEMIFTIKDTLTNLGANPENIHFELFNTDGIKKQVQSSIRQKENIDSSSQSQVSIKMDGDIFEFTLPYGGLNLLDAALENGADLPYACKGGVCSTCRAKLVNGEVSMDLNYALEADELEAGFILLCQAHPRSSNISIDFDQK